MVKARLEILAMLCLNSALLMMIIVFRSPLPKAPVVFQLLENKQKKIGPSALQTNSLSSVSTAS